ncbi:MAG: tetratricopeptide repeat protein [Bacteroidales bacterium]
MESAKIIKTYNLITDLVNRKRTKEALDLLHKLIKQSQVAAYETEWSTIAGIYSNILKYAISGVHDPQQEEVYQNTLRKVLHLADKVKQSLLLQYSPAYRFRKERLKKDQVTPGSDIEQALTRLTSGPTVDDILYEEEKQPNERSPREKAIDHLFDTLWLTDHYTIKEQQLIEKLFKQDLLEWYERAVMITAITLSLLRTFDVKKFHLLFDIYRFQEDQNYQRALTGLLLALFRHNKRLFLYPELEERLEQEYQANPFEDDTESMIIQLLKAKDTDRVTRKLQEEIMPELIKLQPKIQEKLDLDKLLGQEDFQDQNPEWEEFFEDSPGLMDKLQELTDMQLEGNDVFMSTFARLKHFAFFNRVPNWFLPFYNENPTAEESLAGEHAFPDPSALIESIAGSQHMCNSDKYSFVLNLKHLPDQQKQMMGNMIKAEFDQMKEVAEDENLINQQSKNKKIITQYIQDLYRFFKIHPMHTELDDIFSYRMDFYNKDFYDKIVRNDAITRRIAEYYFSKKHFDKAEEVFEMLLEKQPEDPMEIFEKLAYSCEKQQNYEKAVDFYKKAELFDTNRLWNLKKIAYNYQMLKQADQAIDFYKQAEKIAKEDIYIKIQLGNTYLAKEDCTKALEYYHQAKQIAPDNYHIWRPLAWCSFVSGDFEQGGFYLKQLMEIEDNKYDLMNAGHVAFCLNNKEEASNYYVKSVQARNNDFKAFLEAFKEDRKHLLKHGVSEDDIALVLDHVRYQL